MTEWDAVEYSRRSLLQEAMGQEVLALLDLQGSERILDVGCGDGKITAEIAARVPRGSVVGVDPSRDMISFAQSHYGPATTHNLRFQVADARSLSFQSEFDRVVSFNALHWIPEQNAALSSIHSALISGGKAQLRLVPAGERPELGKCSRSNASSLEMGRLLPGFSQSLSASDTGTVCSRGGAQWLPRPTRFHERSDVGFWVAGGILRFLRRRLRRMDGPPARGRTSRLHQRCPGPLSSSSRRWQRRRTYLQVLSDGY